MPSHEVEDDLGRFGVRVRRDTIEGAATRGAGWRRGNTRHQCFEPARSRSAVIVGEGGNLTLRDVQSAVPCVGGPTVRHVDATKPERFDEVVEQRCQIGSVAVRNHDRFRVQWERVRQRAQARPKGTGAVAFTRDGRQFAVSTSRPHSKVALYDLRGTRQQMIEGVPNRIWSLDISPDGKLLAGLDDTSALVYELKGLSKV